VRFTNEAFLNKHEYYQNCKFFKGDIPCVPHKKSGVHCIDCKEYQPQKGHILIIKLGAIGDVIRTTPLLHTLKKKYPLARIYWLTYSPEVLPSIVDVPLTFTEQDIYFVKAIQFDLVLNLDKDKEACAITSLIHAKKKRGYTLLKGKPAPIDELAKHKYLTGIYDDLSKQNTKNYLEEIFEIGGYSFNDEEYILELPPRHNTQPWKINHSKTVVGLNTGCGERWPSRLWATENWIQLAKSLKRNGKEVIILGGESEDKTNKLIAKKSGVKYYGFFPLDTFFLLINECDVLVTTVTMALHVGIGLKKKIVLLNNIFNKNEFELYGRGIIIEPAKECKCYYSQRCTNTEYFCMDHLSSQRVMDTINSLLNVA
jgi:ADP-heptose:LPS heptosyltransferase